MPSEHGGWSLTAEPVVLGLLVAFSWAGLALGVAAMVAFVARTPLKLMLVDRSRHRWLDRSKLATRVFALEAVLIVVLGAVAFLGAQSSWFWVPLACAAPLVAMQLWFDMRSRSRRLLPELAGTIGMGSVVAAIVLAGGADAELAVGLWAVVSARAAAAIPYARTQVLRGHGGPVTRWHSDVSQVVSVVALVVVGLFATVPLASVLAVAAVAAFNVIAVRLRPRRAVVIGLQQTFFGVAVIVITAIAVLV